MSYDSFTIRGVSDDKDVDLDQIDRLICEHLGVEYNDHDYAMLTFTETDKESVLTKEPMAWTVFLHNIIRLSSLPYGRQDRNSLMGALEYMRYRDAQGYLPEFNDQRELRLRFPESAKRLLAQILYCLEKEGYYIFVRYPDYMAKCNYYPKVIELAKDAFKDFTRYKNLRQLTTDQWTKLVNEGFPVKLDPKNTDSLTSLTLPNGEIDFSQLDITPLAEKISLELLRLDEPLERCDSRLHDYALDCMERVFLKCFRY